MSHKPRTAPAQEFRLPGHDVLAIGGRDAVAFAQAQFMNDVAALDDGGWHWNGWLTPKGRVIALFALLRQDAETLWLVLPDAGAGELATQLQRFVFRSKVRLQPRDDLHANGRFGAPALASGSTIAQADGAFELDLGADGGPRCLRIANAAAEADAALASRWRGFDLQHGLPRLRDAQLEAWTPQHLSLDRLRAYSVKKGCYPGQEIVARTHFLGQVKRGLALFHAGAPLPEGSAISADGRDIGSVACVEEDLALAVMPLDAPAAGLVAAGIDLLPAPLLGGLAR
ncbi:MAG: folate-binding protein YgfZ [Thermomonas sp.]|nr:folate-binding protein YgfZ [Thermomonas sp.]